MSTARTVLDLDQEMELYETNEVDDDPRCTNCQAYRSEHGVNGPCDGFTTQPGGFMVYTQSDLEDMSWEEQAALFGWEELDYDRWSDD